MHSFPQKHLKQILDERDEGHISPPKISIFVWSAWRGSAVFWPGSCDKVIGDSRAGRELWSHPDVSPLMSVQKR